MLSKPNTGTCIWQNLHGVPSFLSEQFEQAETRELKQIFDGQNMIHSVLRELNRKIDEVVGRQERTMSQLAMMQQGGGQPAQGGNNQVSTALLPLLSTGVMFSTTTVVYWG